ncbi:acetyltransferase [Paraflavisolibacter sp. H34]|uniref:acetyltransferase n=1 Tax=Huijunlia imazamoxiresistens TaxID=3127457 RepID=UPI003015F71B
MKQVAVIGFGVLGQQLVNFLKEAGPVQQVIAFDDTIGAHAAVETVYPFARYREPEFGDYDFYVGIGYKHLAARNRILADLKSLGRRLPSLIHATAYVSPYAQIGEGCLIFPQCNIDQNVVLGDGNILHNSVVISHDGVIGRCNYFSPSVTLCGNVQMGSENFLGAGVTVSNGLTIENESRIGVGSCITKNIEANVSVIGNPQKQLQKQLNLW